MVLILAFFGAFLVSHFVVDTTFDALGWKGFEVTCSPDAANMEHCGSTRDILIMLLAFAIWYAAWEVDERFKR